MPLSCASIGAATLLAITSAVAPGYTAAIVTCGGDMSGYCSSGDTDIDTAPASTISSEITDDRIGRSMKKWVNTARACLLLLRRLAGLRWSLLGLRAGVDDLHRLPGNDLQRP